MINVEQRLTTISKMEVKSWMPTVGRYQELRSGAMLRSSTVGFLLGTPPGMRAVGHLFLWPTTWKKRASKHPERFGHGAMDGLALRKGRTSATSTAGFVPLFSFGASPQRRSMASFSARGLS